MINDKNLFDVKLNKLKNDLLLNTTSVSFQHFFLISDRMYRCLFRTLKGPGRLGCRLLSDRPRDETRLLRELCAKIRHGILY